MKNNYYTTGLIWYKTHYQIYKLKILQTYLHYFQNSTLVEHLNRIRDYLDIKTEYDQYNCLVHNFYTQLLGI